MVVCVDGEENKLLILCFACLHGMAFKCRYICKVQMFLFSYNLLHFACYRLQFRSLTSAVNTAIKIYSL